METNITAAPALTGADWVGLPLALCQCSGRMNVADVPITEPLLVLHEIGGAETEVRRGTSSWKFTAEAGCFDFYPAGTYGFLLDPLPRCSIVVTITDKFARAAMQGRWPDHGLPRFQFRDRRLERLVKATVAHCRHRDPRTDGRALSLAIADRLHALVEPSRTQEPVLSAFMRGLLEDHLERNLGMPVDLELAARLTGLARTQFVGAFREAFGQSLHQYLLARRIERAKAELRLPDVSLTSVAHQLGFANHAHFTTVFKRRVGVTPSEYRKKNGVDAKALAH